mmetsp:Transcript_14524/g.39849  ORF Transcript_14524/g.39849 Transcript_14524/m.39849 type:complete len:231 (-) Transcript_14524:923-1615(-)
MSRSVPLWSNIERHSESHRCICVINISSMRAASTSFPKRGSSSQIGSSVSLTRAAHSLNLSPTSSGNSWSRTTLNSRSNIDSSSKPPPPGNSAWLDARLDWLDRVSESAKDCMLIDERGASVETVSIDPVLPHFAGAEGCTMDISDLDSSNSFNLEISESLSSNKFFNSFDESCLFAMAQFFTALARCPNRRVLTLSAQLSTEGDTVTIRVVLLLPPKLSCRMRVNLESR